MSTRRGAQLVAFLQVLFLVCTLFLLIGTGLSRFTLGAGIGSAILSLAAFALYNRPHHHV